MLMNFSSRGLRLARHPVASAIAGAVIASLVVGLGPSAGDEWIERDAQGVIRLRGGFSAEGDYKLELFDANGKPVTCLLASAGGDASLTLGAQQARLVLAKRADSAEIDLRGEDGMYAKLRVQPKFAALTVGHGEESQALLRSSVDDGAELVLMKTKSGRSWGMQLKAGEAGSSMVLSENGRAGIRLESPLDGPRAITIGTEKATGLIDLRGHPSGECSLQLADPDGKTRVALQQNEKRGSGLVVFHPSGSEGVTLGINAQGQPVGKLTAEDGQVIEDLGSTTAGTKDTDVRRDK